MCALTRLSSGAAASRGAALGRARVRTDRLGPGSVSVSRGGCWCVRSLPPSVGPSVVSAQLTSVVSQWVGFSSGCGADGPPTLLSAAGSGGFARACGWVGQSARTGVRVWTGAARAVGGWSLCLLDCLWALAVRVVLGRTPVAVPRDAGGRRFGAVGRVCRAPWRLFVRGLLGRDLVLSRTEWACLVLSVGGGAAPPSLCCPCCARPACAGCLAFGCRPRGAAWPCG